MGMLLHMTLQGLKQKETTEQEAEKTQPTARKKAEAKPKKAPARKTSEK